MSETPAEDAPPSEAELEALLARWPLTAEYPGTPGSMERDTVLAIHRLVAEVRRLRAMSPIISDDACNFGGAWCVVHESPQLFGCCVKALRSVE